MQACAPSLSAPCSLRATHSPNPSTPCSLHAINRPMPQATSHWPCSQLTPALAHTFSQTRQPLAGTCTASRTTTTCIQATQRGEHTSGWQPVAGHPLAGQTCTASRSSTTSCRVQATQRGEHTSVFKARAPGSHPAAYEESAAFAVFKHLNTSENLEAALTAVGEPRTLPTTPEADATADQPAAINGAQPKKTRRLGVRTRGSGDAAAAVFGRASDCMLCDPPAAWDQAGTTPAGVQTRTQPRTQTSSQAGAPAQTQAASQAFNEAGAQEAQSQIAPQAPSQSQASPQAQGQADRQRRTQSQPAAQPAGDRSAATSGDATGSLGLLSPAASKVESVTSSETPSRQRAKRLETTSRRRKTVTTAELDQPFENLSLNENPSLLHPTQAAPVAQTDHQQQQQQGQQQQQQQQQQQRSAALAERQRGVQPVYSGAGESSSVQVSGRRQLARSGTTTLQRLAQVVAEARCMDIKEVMESVEFVERVRRRVRRPCMLDLCAGHGLVGMLLAAVEPTVEHVLMVDQNRPKSFHIARKAVAQLAPWMIPKLTYFEYDLNLLAEDLATPQPPPADSNHQPAVTTTQQNAAAQLAAGSQQGLGPQPAEPAGAGGLVESSRRRQQEELAVQAAAAAAAARLQTLEQAVGLVQGFAGRGAVGVVGVHACGELTDTCLDIAMGLRAPVAVMPCCYTGTAKSVPLGVRRVLGVGMASDVDRSYALSSAGCYTSVDFATIPETVTPANRIIVAQTSIQVTKAKGTVATRPWAQQWL